MYQFCSIVWNYITKTEKTTTNVAVFSIYHSDTTQRQSSFSVGFFPCIRIPTR